MCIRNRTLAEKRPTAWIETRCLLTYLQLTSICLDRHIGKDGHQIAIIHDSAMTGQVTRLTYCELLEAVTLLANVLKEKYHV